MGERFVVDRLFVESLHGKETYVSTLSRRQCCHLLMRRCHLKILDESTLNVLLVRARLIEEKAIEMMNGDHVQQWLA